LLRLSLRSFDSAHPSPGGAPFFMSRLYRVASVGTELAQHRFKLGQKVTAHALGVPVGPYVIIRLLPLVGNDPHYQGRSDAGTVRALLESQIREAAEQTP
jgi:hypothetical protein